MARGTTIANQARIDRSSSAGKSSDTRRGWPPGSVQSPTVARGCPRRTGSCPPSLGGEATMKAILSAALVIGLGGLAGARDEKADPVGTWKCEYEIGDQKRMSTLTIKK